MMNESNAGDGDTVLIADIGGTNCRFELWKIDMSGGRAHQELYHQIFPCKDFPTFPEALAEVARQEVFQANLPKAAAFACAGPVANNKCEMTNLSWVIDGDYLSEAHGIRVAVLNDFEANGYGVTALQPDHLVCLNEVPEVEKVRAPQEMLVKSSGRQTLHIPSVQEKLSIHCMPVQQGPKAVLGPGTGLGEAQLFWDEVQGGYKVWPSEGSHAIFAPRGWKQRALQVFVEKELGACEVEHVACGSGLERIYRFLQSDESCNRPHLGMDKCKARNEPHDAPAITKAALEGSDDLAVEAVDMFLAIIGAEAGYMGLRALATGGVYICGGITHKLIEKIRDRRCLVDSFLHQESRFHKLLRTFPLYAVVYERTGLLGTREYAIRLMGQPSPVAKAAALSAAA
ncbi:Glucokinase [Coccomyxa sp. Obi]|nr:Glucokinase [Coccomyxa sp. Obi]